MGNFERLSVLVIVVIIVLIVVIALVQLTENNEGTPSDGTGESRTEAALSNTGGSGAGTAGGAMNGGTVNGGAINVPGPRPDVRPTPPSPGPISIDRILNPDRPPPLPPGPVGPAPTPTPTPVVDAPKPPESKIHVVQPGDTMQKLAKVYFPGQATKGLDLIQKANPTVDPARMRVGTKLTIPALDGSISATISPTPGGTSTTSTAGTTARTSTTGSSITPGGTYVVKKGDTLASIGRRAYGGRADRWQDIWLANYEAIGERVDDPEPGTRLTIPK